MKLLKINSRTNHNLYTKVDDDVFNWASKLNWHLSGMRKGRIGYVTSLIKSEKTTSGKTQVYLHRVIIGSQDLQSGENLCTNMQIDHINGNVLDNTRENLRLVTSAQNHANSKPKVGKKSKYKGVYPNGYRWMARVKNIYLGTFENEELAALAYNARAVELWQNHAAINRIGVI